MKKVFFLVLFLVSCEISPDLTPVALLGQSNASPELAVEIQAIMPNYYIGQKNHPGKSIINWFDEKAEICLNQDWRYMEVFPPDIIVWFQGESDRDRADTYEQSFLGMRRFLRKKIGNHLKWIICEVYSTNETLYHIREIQESLAADYSDIHIIDTKDLPRQDPAHLSEVGRQMLAKLLKQKIHEIL